MEYEFEQILVLLEKLNKNNDKAAISVTSLQDEWKNIKRFTFAQ